MWRDLVPIIISTVTTLVAVIVAPWVSWVIAKRQIAMHVSSKRQVWIDELRKDVVEMLDLASRIEELKRRRPDLNWEEEREVFDWRMKAESLLMRIKLRLNPEKKKDEVFDWRMKAESFLMRIKLWLNPEKKKDKEHNDLLDAFQELISSVDLDPQPGETDADRQRLLGGFHEKRNKVLEITQEILKREWDRVKKGK